MQEHAPALADLLFGVAAQPPLQFRPVSLKLLTFHGRGGAPPHRGFRLGAIEERLLPAQMPLAELLYELRYPQLSSFPRHTRPPSQTRRGDFYFKAHHGPLNATPGSMLHDLDQVLPLCINLV
eukprot:SAG31_NODE_244_length_19246_cov_20.233823_21_plen_123_part_00